MCSKFNYNFNMLPLKNNNNNNNVQRVFFIVKVNVPILYVTG